MGKENPACWRDDVISAWADNRRYYKDDRGGYGPPRYEDWLQGTERQNFEEHLYLIHGLHAEPINLPDPYNLSEASNG